MIFINSLAAAQSGKLVAGRNDSDLATMANPPAHDIILIETERILADYVALLGRQAEPVLTAR